MQINSETKETASGAPGAPIELETPMQLAKAIWGDQITDAPAEDLRDAAKLYARAALNFKAHADKLAEALREIRNTIAANGGKNVSLDWIESKAGDALAQWEGAK